MSDAVEWYLKAENAWHEQVIFGLAGVYPSLPNAAVPPLDERFWGPEPTRLQVLAARVYHCWRKLLGDFR